MPTTTLFVNVSKDCNIILSTCPHLVYQEWMKIMHTILNVKSNKDFKYNFFHFCTFSVARVEDCVYISIVKRDKDFKCIFKKAIVKIN